MEQILGFIDPGAAVGLLVTFLFVVCTGVLYTMRDPTPFPRWEAHRVRCPHRANSRHRFTIETGPGGGGSVYYCSALPAGEIRCDQACILQQPREPRISHPPRDRYGPPLAQHTSATASAAVTRAQPDDTPWVEEAVIRGGDHENPVHG